ncbi:hypothetical protein P171DRAFT_480476 [Karstenula rhodostoma CBS 690.94]|uniref:Uncharacterized protein n=1 Tax=Karstenula rhodostoma CBS 690.94 TaxID=1392251 RepID=A0A9P4PU99_9PLEO|nr:hypothetical protein P171DRAFT_480476 [Karstenula rhodostoma CBS 690.94]
MPSKRKRQEEAEFGSLWMHAATITPPRRKACLQCFQAKTRRALHCDFSNAASEEPRSSVPPAPPFTTEALTISNTSISATPHTADASPPFPYPTPLFTSPQPTLQAVPSRIPTTDDAQATPLICTVDAERVRDRWLAGWIPAPGQQPKELSRGTAIFIHSVLKAYPHALCQGDLPPIVHGLQRVDGKLPLPLANCVSIARMWEGLGEGEGGSEMVRETTVREIARVREGKENYTSWELLAAFQAYIMYATLLVEPQREIVVPQDIMRAYPSFLNLQDFAHTICLSGLVHPSELPSSTGSVPPSPPIHPSTCSNAHTPGSRPPYHQWALAEAKRRALAAMYLLDDAVNVFSRVSCIRGDELAQMPLPCAEKLWRAEEEARWARLYDVFVAEWEGGGLRLEELWVGAGAGQGDGRRVGRWVRDVDGLGMAVLAVATSVGYR